MAGVETRSKKKPLSPSPHKIGMVEKQTPSSSSDKRKLERADKKGSPSPLRRSGRIEKNGFSSSPSSKKSSNSSSSQGNKNKEENIEKLKTADTDEQGNDNEADTKSGGSSNKRKRLDFRSYRSFLMPQVKRAKCSEEGQKHQKEDDASQDDTVNSGANDPKEIQDGRDDCQLRKVHELKPSGQCCEDLVEGSSSVSTHALENKNQKVFSNGVNATKDEHNSLFTKCSDSSSQSSPVTVTTERNHGSTTERVIDGEGDKIGAYQVSSKELRASELVESPFEETSLAVYDASGKGDTNNLASKSGTAPLNAENSVRETSVEHVASLSPSGIKSISAINMEQNTWCCELQRVHTNLPDSEICSCNSQTRHGLPVSSPEVLQVKKNLFEKLLTFPEGFPPGLDNYHLGSINLLREFWHMSKNAVFVGEQERLVKSILFILALQSLKCRPFLIISTISSLPVWESEFARLAPTVNLVIYSGNKDVRKMIHDVQFYEEGRHIMFQVLLSHPYAVVEDFEVLDCISWEAMIVDECQNSRMSKHFEKLKHLSTDFRLLLLSGQLKDSLAEYLNLLSFLNPGEKENYVNSMKFDSKDTVGALAILKERLSHYLVYEQKPDSSKFIEYWVPVRLSYVQLEQYCSTLLSNSIALRSSSKVDHVGALRDILISTRKCCDHPYIVDPSLQTSLMKDLPPGDYLDIGVNASGKLLLLDKILQEIKNQGRRMLILFQKSLDGAGRNSIGDILDDFLRQRFGADSYERLDGGLIASKKQAALNMFNDRASGRFVFLIDNRACLPSIKLASVDAALIFDSDWNPLNDLRALQKINIESQYEPVKVFRLYSTCTVEEKVLISAKQDMILESNIRTVTPSVSHLLLSWGASHLFSKLTEFHQQDKLIDCADTSTDKEFMNNVVSEVLTELPVKDDDNDGHSCSFLTKVPHSGVSYSRNISLVGEKEGISSLDKDPSSFWSGLFEGRYPRWRYISQSSQRVRRKVQLAKVPEAESDEGMVKRRKVAGNTVNSYVRKDAKALNNRTLSRGSDQSSPSPTKKMLVVPSNISKESEAFPNHPNLGSESTPCSTSGVNMPESEGTEKLCNSQMDLHLMLKPELLNLCGILKLPDDVKSLTEKLLEYVMNNLHVSREPQSILQAFILALCWRAASLLKHNMAHKESLALAKKYLNFECDVAQACSVYLKLKILKKTFSFRRGALKDVSGLTHRENQSLTSTKNVRDQTLKPSESYRVSEGEKMRDGSGCLWSVHDPTKDLVNVIETPGNIKESLESLKGELLEKQIDLIGKVCSRREEQLKLKQQVELSNFNKEKEEEKMKLKKLYDSQLVVTRSIVPDTDKDDKLRLLNHEFFQKMAAFDQHFKFQRTKLAFLQSGTRNKEHQIRDLWLEDAKAGRLVELFDDVPLSHSQFMLEGFMVSEEICEGPGNAKLTCRPDQQCHDVNRSGLAEPIGSSKQLSEIQPVTPNGFVNNITSSTEPSVSHCNGMNVEEYSLPTGISTGVPASVSAEVACDLTVETNPPATHLDVAGNLLNGVEEEVLVVTEASSSPCGVITEVEPTESSLENPVAGLPGVSGVVGDIVNGEEENILVETEASTSQCKDITEVGLTEMSALSGVAGDLPMETVSSPSHPFAMIADGNKHMLSSPRRTAAADVEQDICADASGGPCLTFSQESGPEFLSSSNTPGRTNQVHCDEHDTLGLSGGMASHLDFSSLSQVAVPVLDEHERLNVSNAVETDQVCSSSPQIAVLNDERREVSDDMETAQVCSSTPQVALPPSDSVDNVHAFDSPPLPAVPMLHEHEIREVSDCMGTGEAFRSPRQAALSVVDSVDSVRTQVEQINHNQSMTDSLQQTPAHTNVQLDQHSPVQIICFPAASEEGHLDKEHIPDKQNDVPQSIVDPPLHVGQPDTVVSVCDVNQLPNSAPTPGGTFSEDVSSDQFHHSTNENEVPMQLPVSDTYLLVEQGNPVIPNDAGSFLSPTTMPGRTCSGDLDTDLLVDRGNQVIPDDAGSLLSPTIMPGRSCSGDLDTYLLVEQGNQVISDDAGSLLSPTAVPGRTCSGDLSNSYYQTTEQTEVVVPLPSFSSVLQVEQSDQLISHNVDAASAQERYSGALSNTSHQTHCPTRQTESLMLQSNEAANVQDDQSNLLNTQPVVHPVAPPLTILHERSQSEDTAIVQPDCGSRFLQNLTMSNWMPPQGPHPDPLQNELMKIRRQKDLCLKLQEDKKLQLHLQRNLEMDRIRQKYDALLQNAETEFHRDNMMLDTIYNKVEMNRILAEQFRARFIENKGGASSSLQGSGSGSGSGSASRSSYMQHLLHAGQPQVAQRPVSASPSTSLSTVPPVAGSASAAPPPPTSLTPGRLWTPTTAVSSPPVAGSASAAPPPTSLASGRLWTPTTAVSPIASTRPTCHSSSTASKIIPIRPQFSPALPARASLQVGNETRYRPPHLQHLQPFRPHSTMSAQNLLVQIGGVTNVQQPTTLCQPTTSALSPSAMVPPTPTYVASGGPGTLPLGGGNSMLTFNLPPDAGVSNVGADLTNIGSDVVTNTAFPGTEVPPGRSMNAAKQTGTSDVVVCISDDEE